MTERNRKSPLESALEPLLAEWLTNEEAKAEFHRFRPEPKPVSDFLNRAASKCIKPWTLKLMTLQNAWTEIAGPDLARKCTVSSINEGTVYVEVRHPAFIAALNTAKIKSLLLEKICRELEDESITEIKLIASGGRGRL